MASSDDKQSRIIFWATVVALSTFVYWLNIEFRGDGILAALQIYGAGLVVFPYYVGVLAGSLHVPIDVGILVGLLLEFTLLVWLFRFLYKNSERAWNDPHIIYRTANMIGYLTVGTNDLERAASFYDALLAEIGAKRVMTDERMLGWGTSPNETMFSVIKPFDGNDATVGNGVMIAFNVETQANVEKVYTKALALGATDEGHPHDRGSSMGFYGGYFRDLDGNKLVAYCLGAPK